MTDIPLKCACGAVQGIATNVSPDSGTRIVCYCDDCQRFARYLGRDDILDEYGGTDIFPIPPAEIKLVTGVEQVRCVRLTSKGLYRWYTACCKTPIGNTMSAGIPYIGMICNFIDDGGRDKNIGPVRGYVQVKFAGEALPIERKQAGFPWRVTISILCRLLVWKLRGKGRPSPFFDSSGKPVSEPHVLAATIK